MRKKSVKGLVLEKSGKNIILLTPDSGFLRVPSCGRAYGPGMEVEVELPHKKKLSFMLSAAVVAAALFVVTFLMPALSSPDAYLAFDLNPGFVFSLDKNAVVVDAAPVNEDGKRMLESMEAKGVHILKVLETLLEEAYLSGYLSVGKHNMIIVSLAAPDGFSVCEKDLSETISNKLIALGVDTYLKIIVAGPDKAREAKRMEIPLNALLLGEAMKDFMIVGEGHSLVEGSPPQQVCDFLQSVNPANIFSQNEFIPGESGKDGRKADRSAPPANHAVENRDGSEEKELSGVDDKDYSEPAEMPDPSVPRKYLPPEQNREYP